MRTLVTGARGYLGNRLCELLPRRGLEAAGIDIGDGDLRDRKGIRKIVEATHPDIIIHTAAFTDVERCESDLLQAYGVNVFGTHNVVEAAKFIGAKVVYISSDYVFDGQKGNYSEEDPPNPVNRYGRTKLFAEEIVKQGSSEFLIVRTSTLYGPSSCAHGFAHRTVEALRHGERIRAAVDQISNPTYLEELAESLAWLVKAGANRMLHVAGPQAISRFEFACRIAEVFELDPALITPVTLKQLDVNRPKNVSLRTEKLQKLGIRLSAVAQGLKQWKDSEVEGHDSVAGRVGFHTD